MNTRHAPSPLARAFAGVMLAASVVTGAGSASAGTCTFAFPHNNRSCIQGTSGATVSHVLNTFGQLAFNISINMIGGTTGAVAYGIDVNGTHLNGCNTKVADNTPSSFFTTPPVPGPLLGCPSGTTVPSSRTYNHPRNMRSTFVAVV